MKPTLLISLLVFSISQSAFAVSAKKSLSISDYLEISCENVVKKTSDDLFLKQLKNKLLKIHKANGNNSSINSICDELGEAQFSRLMEDEHLLFEKK